MVFYRKDPRSYALRHEIEMRSKHFTFGVSGELPDTPVVHGDWTVCWTNRPVSTGVFVLQKIIVTSPLLPTGSWEGDYWCHATLTEPPDGFPPALWSLFWHACDNSYVMHMRKVRKEQRKARLNAWQTLAKERGASISELKTESLKKRKENAETKRLEKSAKALSKKINTLAAFSNELKSLVSTAEAIQKMMVEGPESLALPRSVATFLRESRSIRNTLNLCIRQTKKQREKEVK